jgi:molecular chaperone DnaK
MIFQTEKHLKEVEDKIPADKKKPIEDALGKLKEAHKNQDVDAIEKSMEELNTVFQAASQDIYNAQNADQQQEQGKSEHSEQSEQTKGSKQEGKSKSGDDDDEVTDVDFEEVK